MMRVMINSSALTGGASGRGLGRYTSCLHEALASTEEFVAQSTRAPVLASRLPVRIESWAASSLLAAELIGKKPDIYHATSVYEMSILKAPRDVKIVLSIQDIIPLDLSEYTRTGVRAKFFHGLARRADVILVQSEHTKRRIVDRLRIREEKIFKAPLPVQLRGVDPRNRELSLTDVNLPELPDDRRFIATLADLRTYDPRKRFAVIADVAKMLEREGVFVVVIGAGTEQLDSSCTNLVGLGRLSDEEMFAVYKRAELFIYASSYEGQGLPPQEALLAGTPVVAPANTSLTEMIGPGGVFVSDTDDDQLLSERLCGAVTDLLKDGGSRLELSTRGLEHVEKFTKELFVSRVLDAYTSARS